ncbi:unnamed protein product [Vitrella brassicaformis CCMP3155]|uniref:Protein root UVB sensitive/RUS domain-containing protein n=4 Tax=Vitrella brassicaformis TaxID=1169539 RepID=A0A0G4EZA4_VITBC|nr:unnamed protein product [Vitrella brassicaformis CCMP3155]|eukprot:CEM04426.1 unnamed protein product [Vitrella brassicaformis CCMP3155]
MAPQSSHWTEQKGEVVRSVATDADAFRGSKAGVHTRRRGLRLTALGSLLSIEKHWKALCGAFVEIFLPTGFPHTVCADYLPYQVWDSCQAFCSTVTGLLASQSVLRIVGVGDAAATASSAVLVWVMRDGFGMVGRIAFSWQWCNQLDLNAKTWRFMADILNDAGMTLELLTPPRTSPLFMPTLCGATLCKAVCGVAGGATRAALTLHFSVADNAADVSAKDGSQETLVNLLGMIVGSYIIKSIEEDPFFVRLLFAVFTALHLLFNYLAVRSVVMTTFNYQRFMIAAGCFLQTGHVPSPETVAIHEKLFWPVEAPLIEMVVKTFIGLLSMLPKADRWAGYALVGRGDDNHNHNRHSKERARRVAWRLLNKERESGLAGGFMYGGSIKDAIDRAHDRNRIQSWLEEWTAHVPSPSPSFLYLPHMRRSIIPSPCGPSIKTYALATQRPKHGRFRAPPPPQSSASSSPVSSYHGSDTHSPTKEAIPAPLPPVFFHACVLHRLAVGAVSALDDGAKGQDGGVIRMGWLTHAQRLDTLRRIRAISLSLLTGDQHPLPPTPPSRPTPAPSQSSTATHTQTQDEMSSHMSIAITGGARGDWRAAMGAFVTKAEQARWNLGTMLIEDHGWTLMRAEGEEGAGAARRG